MTPNGQTILIVEDDAGIRESMEELLAEEGYRVRAAQNGEEALAMLAAEPPPALIVLDWWMPVMSGAQLLEAMRADARLAGVRVLVVSAANEALGVGGVAGILKKPVRLELLLETVGRLTSA